jgi:hypothetical protein
LVVGEEVLGDELLELVELSDELLAPAPLEVPRLPELDGDALLPLEAPPRGQSAPTQFDELPAAVVPVVVDEVPLPDAVLELGDWDGVVVLAPVVVLLPPALLPLFVLLPLCAHATANNAAATAAPMVFRSMCFLLGGWGLPAGVQQTRCPRRCEASQARE